MSYPMLYIEAENTDGSDVAFPCAFSSSRISIGMNCVYFPEMESGLTFILWTDKMAQWAEEPAVHA